MKTNFENLVSLLMAKEQETIQLRLYIERLEDDYDYLFHKYEQLKKRKIKRNPIGFKMKGVKK